MFAPANLLSVIGEKGRNVPDLGVLNVCICINAAKRTLEAEADYRAALGFSSRSEARIGYAALERHSVSPKKEDVLWQKKRA